MRRAASTETDVEAEFACDRRRRPSRRRPVRGPLPPWTISTCRSRVATLPWRSPRTCCTRRSPATKSGTAYRPSTAGATQHAAAPLAQRLV